MSQQGRTPRMCRLRHCQLGLPHEPIVSRTCQSVKTTFRNGLGLLSPRQSHRPASRNLLSSLQHLPYIRQQWRPFHRRRQLPQRQQQLRLPNHRQQLVRLLLFTQPRDRKCQLYGLCAISTTACLCDERVQCPSGTSAPLLDSLWPT